MTVIACLENIQTLIKRFVCNSQFYIRTRLSQVRTIHQWTLKKAEKIHTPNELIYPSGI